MILKNMGPKWVYHRTLHSLKLKTKYYSYIEKKYGEIEQELNVDRTIESLLDFKKIKKIDNNVLKKIRTKKKDSIINEADELLNNHFIYFYNDKFHFNRVDWHYNPYNKKRQDPHKKWYEIPMHNLDDGDIKDYWELNRFVFVYSLINAYQLTNDSKYADKFIELVLDWIEKNKFEYGVNFKCSQETSFRCLNWLLGLLHLNILENYPRESKIILESIFKQSYHVKELMPYSVNCVKNNHTLNEALFLYIIGGYFKFPSSNKIHKLGKNIYNDALNKQVLSDGSYIQNSHNYHRLMLLSAGMFKYFEKKQNDLSPASTQAILKATKFLKHFILRNGDVPNYGANDGSIPFNFLNTEYRDFKFCIDFVYKVFSDEYYYGDYNIGLDAWFNSKNIAAQKQQNEKNGSKFFQKGGYLILKNNNKKLFMRVMDGKRRPGQPDNNSIDLWNGDKNLIIDTGSYKYSAKREVLDYFKGSKGHNYLRINNEEPMNRITQFMYSNWSKSIISDMDLSNNKVKIKNVDYKKFNVSREIKLNNELHIMDNIHPKADKKYLIELFFHFDEIPELISERDNLLSFKFYNGNKINYTSNQKITFQIYNGSNSPFLGWKSLYYNKLEKCYQIVITVEAEGELNFNTKYIFRNEEK